MLLPFQKPPLRVEASPHLGPMLLDVSYLPGGGVLPPLPPPPGVPAVTADPYLTLLTQIHLEVAGLRADLASRTLGARLRRAWAWCRSLFEA